MPGWLLDTQLLFLLACRPDRLGAALAAELADRQRPVDDSVVSLWKVAIKASLGRPDFQLDASTLRQGLQREGFRELPIAAEQVLAVQQLPWIHRDPSIGCWWCRPGRSSWSCSAPTARSAPIHTFTACGDGGCPAAGVRSAADCLADQG